MPDTINSVSPSIRDYLLNRNLILADSIVNNGLSGAAVGLGGLSSIDALPVSVQASEDIEVSSIEVRDKILNKNPYQSTDDRNLVNIHTTSDLIKPGTTSEEYGKSIGSETEDSDFQSISKSSREIQTLKNRYISAEDMVNATVINNSFSYNQVDGGYLDENNQINYGGASTDTYDAIGSVLTQKGFGLGESGLLTQFDIRNSLAGRALNGLGAINDTPLGVIGGEQLLLALGQKATFNLQKETLGKINLQPFSLLNGANFVVPNWSITTRSSVVGRIFDTGEDIAGLELPLSKLDDGADIFYLGLNTTNGNEVILQNTGKGQLTTLFNLLNYTNGDTERYAPNYSLEGDNNNLGVMDPKIYANKASDLIDITDPTWAFETSEEGNFWDAGFISPLDSDKSLIARTQRMFSNNENAIYDKLFNKQGIEGEGNRILNTSSHGRLSKGSGVVSQGAIQGTDNDNVFCRTWTSTETYGRVKDLQKNSGLYELNGDIRNNVENSVLGKNGFVKISPYKMGSDENGRGDIKKFMFSIENLAWNDVKTQLPKQELGPGDLVSGKSGRIMWFPPYDMKFTDTSAVSWDTTKFIGRGEPIYTYNSTERTGTLSFQIIIDYPNYINNSQLKTDEVLASLAAGCSDYNEILSTLEADAIRNEVNKVNKVKDIVAIPQLSPEPIVMFFPNDAATLINAYELNGNGTAGSKSVSLLPQTVGEGYTSPEGTLFENSTDFGLNSRWAKDSEDFIIKKRKSLDNCPACDIIITGYASKAGNSTSNDDLSIARAKAAHVWVLENLGDSNDKNFTKRIKTAYKGDTESSAVSEVHSFSSKKDRFASIIFKYNPKNDPQIQDTANIKSEPDNNAKRLTTSVINRFHNEGEYFKELENSDVNSDKILFSNIREQVDLFQPAFHSITPEGFNSRLTFLKQCTRQGPTNKNVGSQNLAFGSPPICILRVGDFYHTKIVINNLGLSYEPLVWDLNPEGVGVQPMLAKVSIDFKFIGGSSLNGPINKLQNAVSFNFFGNSEVYDPRADTIVATKDEDKLKSEFTIKDGVKKLITTEIIYEEELQNLDLNEKDPIDDSISEIESKKTVAPATTGTDKTELKQITVISSTYTNNNTEVQLEFKYKKLPTSTFQLSKEYLGSLIFNSNVDNTVNHLLGKIKVTPVSETSFKATSFEDTDETVIEDSTTIFQIGLYNLSNESIEYLTQANTNGGGVIKLTFPTGSNNSIIL